MNTQNGSGNFSVFGLPGYSDMFTINGTDYLNSYGDNNKSGATNTVRVPAKCRASQS